jgi:hypothetical protein
MLAPPAHHASSCAASALAGGAAANMAALATVAPKRTVMDRMLALDA